MRRGALLILVALAAGGCGTTHTTATVPAPATPSPAPVTHGHSVADPAAPDFELRDQHGAYVRLSQQHGKVVLLTFLYTQCREECPLIASTIAAAYRGLSTAARKDVTTLAITVDPAHDTRAAVRTFVAQHRLPPQFHYLTGLRDELKPVWQGYNLLIDVKSVQLVNHSAYVLLLDRTGIPRMYYDAHVSPSELEHGLLRYLAQAKGTSA